MELMGYSRELSEWDLQRIDTKLTHRLDQLDAEWRRRFDDLERQVKSARDDFGIWMAALCGPFLFAVIIWAVVLRSL